MYLAHILMAPGLLAVVSAELALCFLGGIPSPDAPARVQLLLAGEAAACLITLLAKVRRRLLGLQKRQAASLASAIRGGAV